MSRSRSARPETFIPRMLASPLRGPQVGSFAPVGVTNPASRHGCTCSRARAEALPLHWNVLYLRASTRNMLARPIGESEAGEARRSAHKRTRALSTAGLEWAGATKIEASRGGLQRSRSARFEMRRKGCRTARTEPWHSENRDSGNRKRAQLDELVFGYAVIILYR